MLSRSVVGLDQVDECTSPTLAGVVDLVAAGPVRDVLGRQNARVEHLLVVGVRGVTDDMDLVRVARPRSLSAVVQPAVHPRVVQVAVRVVAPDAAAFHQPQECELEVLSYSLPPPGYVA